MRFVQLASGIDTTPVLLELLRNADLWDRNPMRRLTEGSPHAEMRDIFVRYMPEADITSETRRSEHRNVFWQAWHALPSLRPMVFALMSRVQAVELGSILITKLPPGGEIHLHSDAGSWGPTFYNTKAHVQLVGTSVTTVEGEAFLQKQGDVITFDNLLMHGIKNVGENDRITLIVSMRVE